MTDLVERLRRGAAVFKELGEAADEIERLRSENRCLQFRIECQRNELSRLNAERGVEQTAAKEGE